MNHLLLHCGAELVNYDQLSAVPTPKATYTWMPIAHVKLLNAIRDELAATGLVVACETYALSQARTGNWGDRFFGLLEIEGRNPDYAFSLGLRNSHDCRFPAGLCVGSRVFVCDNLSFSAEVVIARKHTKFLCRDLPRLIYEAVGRLEDLRQRQDQRIEAYQATPLRDDQLHDLTIRALDSQVICASKIPRVLDLYRHPDHESFEAHTVWSAFNAFTEALKGYDLQDLPRRTRTLHGL